MSSVPRLRVGLGRASRVLNRVLLALLLVLGFAVAVLGWLWSDRPRLDEIEMDPLPMARPEGTGVTATWFGVSTLLFDDFETQLLIDGFFSRPRLVDLLLDRPIGSHAVSVNYALTTFRMRRLAAVIPCHSHFDHAIDIGAIANRSSASVLGSESAAAIARGARVPEDQISVAEPGREYAFGQFRVSLIGTPHAPIGWRGTTPVGGTIRSPFETPAPASAFREGGSWSIVVAHPAGTTIVQCTAGFVAGALDHVDADVVMLGVGLLETLGRQHALDYWRELVTATGARRVFLLHFDDFTKPFGKVVPLPRILDDLVTTTRWLRESRASWDADTRLFLPVFGRPMVLYPAAEPEA